MDNPTNEEWLVELFEFENCEECGRDEYGHFAGRDVLGNRHAYCLSDPSSPVRK